MQIMTMRGRYVLIAREVPGAVAGVGRFAQKAAINLPMILAFAQKNRYDLALKLSEEIVAESKSLVEGMQRLSDEFIPLCNKVLGVEKKTNEMIQKLETDKRWSKWKAAGWGATSLCVWALAIVGPDPGTKAVAVVKTPELIAGFGMLFGPPVLLTKELTKVIFHYDELRAKFAELNSLVSKLSSILEAELLQFKSLTEKLQNAKKSQQDVSDRIGMVLEEKDQSTVELLSKMIETEGTTAAKKWEELSKDCDSVLASMLTNEMISFSDLSTRSIL